MLFHDLTELKQYIDRMVLMGLGHARPMLDRRGCDCGTGPVPLGDPGAGKDDLGGGVMTGITVNLRSTWLIEFVTGSYQATLTGGNLADAMSRIYNTGSPQVLVNSSAAATVIYGEGGGTAPTAAQNAQATRDLFETDPPPVNVTHFNGNPTVGSGTPADPVRPA